MVRKTEVRSATGNADLSAAHAATAPLCFFDAEVLASGLPSSAAFLFFDAEDSTSFTGNCVGDASGPPAHLFKLEETLADERMRGCVATSCVVPPRSDVLLAKDCSPSVCLCLQSFKSDMIL